MTLPNPAPRAYDVLGSPEPAARRTGRGRARGLAVALVGTGVVVVAGGAVAVAGFLSGGGAQPEDALPAGAIGMVKLDLDPAAGQKLAVYRLAERFPSTAGTLDDVDDLEDEILSSLFEDAQDVDYARDVAPWIGDRAGVALVPGGEEPQPLLAVAYTDRAGAEQGLERLAAQDGETFYAFSANADFVLLGPTQELVDGAAEAQDVLADDTGWQDGVAALEGDQVVTAWADLGRLMESLPQEARDAAAEAYGAGADLELSGAVVVGAHAGDDHVEVVGELLGLRSSAQLGTVVDGGPQQGLLTGLPADTLAAFSATGLGAALAEAFDTGYSAEDPLGLVPYAEQLGIRLPEDLQALFGEETVVAAFPDHGFAARSRTSDVEAAFSTASTLAQLAVGDASSDAVRRLDDGVAVGTDAAALDAIATSDGGLGETAAFRAAVPEAEEASALLYVDVAAALALLGETTDADLAQLQSVGMSSTGDSQDASFRLRLTLRDE